MSSVTKVQSLNYDEDTYALPSLGQLRIRLVLEQDKIYLIC
jgi:hypothetical protein